MKVDLAEAVVGTITPDAPSDGFRSRDSLDTGICAASSIDDEMLTQPLSSSVKIGTLVGFLESGEPLVDFPGNGRDKPLPARSTVPLDKTHSGRSAVLLFEDSDRRKPIVVGLLQEPGRTNSASTSAEDLPQRNHVQVEVDGDRLVITAEREIVLRCGEASITLTRAGKVLIRGTYLVSRSSGMNRIKGGAVHIN